MSAETLAAAGKTPLVEVVLGVQFYLLPGLTNAHLGAYWKYLGADWPVPNDAAPIPNAAERFREEEIWQPFQLAQISLESRPRTRIQIRSAGGDRMIQAQNGRFHYNWSSVGPELRYPRYEILYGEFGEALSNLRRFLTVEGLGDIRPNLWELTYTNQILKGTLWTTPGDWGRIFRRPDMFPARLGNTSLEMALMSWHGEIAPRRGRLHLDIQHGRSGASDGPETVTISLTARGPATSEYDFAQGLDLGHNVILSAFRDLTSDEALNYWGLTDASC